MPFIATSFEFVQADSQVLLLVTTSLPEHDVHVEVVSSHVRQSESHASQFVLTWIVS